MGRKVWSLRSRQGAFSRAVVLCACVAAGWGGGWAGVSAQEVGPVVGDRPGLGFGTSVLPEGVMQAEGGVAYGSGAGDRFSLGQAVFRLGMAGFELQGFANSLVIEQGTLDDRVGFEDLGVGAKLGLGESGAWRWAALGLVTLPTGANAFSNREVTAGATLIGETSLTGSVGLAVNAGYAFPFDGPADGTFSLILTPGFPIPGLDGVSGYAGTASFFGSGPDVNILEAGVAWTRDADTQLDVNWGIDTDSRDWFLGVGLVRRWR